MIHNNPSDGSFRQNSAQTAPPSHPQLDGLENLPATQLHTWNFKYLSPYDNKTYEGQFTCKKLSVMELSRLGVRKTQLNGGFHYDEEHPGQGVEEHIDSMNSMVAHLEVALVQYPLWFNLDQLIDPMILRLVYKEVAKFENNFFRRAGQRSESGRSSQDDSSGTDQKSGAVGLVTAVGGEEIPASVDP
jgi:hypothetical protein